MFLPHRLLHAVRLAITEPRYFASRVGTIVYQMKHPDNPWLTARAIEYIESKLDGRQVVFEWGSGRSTLWFAHRAASVVSVEDNREWFENTRPRLDGLPVEYLFIESTDAATHYPGAILAYPDQAFDLVLIDGSYRDACVRNAATKVRIGGAIVVDNAEQSIDTNTLSENFDCVPTSNGVWRTDIYVRRH